jgi:hypothetical protein
MHWLWSSRQTLLLLFFVPHGTNCLVHVVSGVPLRRMPAHAVLCQHQTFIKGELSQSA